MATARVNGVNLYYEEAGQGVPLLFIHAFPVGRRMWAPQVAFFARDFRVIVYDCRGFGRSEAPTSPAAYSPAHLVEDARALLEHLDATPAVVCGLSMGGYTALGLALAHPACVRALVLCATGAGGEDPGAFRARCEEYAEAARRGMAAFLEASRQWSTFDGFAGRGPREAQLFAGFVLAQPPHGIALTARHVLAPRRPVYELAAELRRLAVPTLVVCGEADEAALASSRFLAETIPGARLLILPGGSHFANLDHPDEFNAAVQGFLVEQGLAPAAAGGAG